jgi:hypothetical protein
MGLKSGKKEETTKPTEEKHSPVSVQVRNNLHILMDTITESFDLGSEGASWLAPRL